MRSRTAGYETAPAEHHLEKLSVAGRRQKVVETCPQSREWTVTVFATFARSTYALVKGSWVSHNQTRAGTPVYCSVPMPCEAQSVGYFGTDLNV